MGLLEPRLLIGTPSACASVAAQTEELVSKVAAAADGNAMMVLDVDSRQHEVRLQAIDAPEKAQDRWRAPMRHLASRVSSQLVEVEYHTKDRHGRIVELVRLDGVDINHDQIAGGAAWFYWKHTRELPREMQTAYAAAEGVAKARQVGLWQSSLAVRPWKWWHRKPIN